MATIAELAVNFTTDSSKAENGFNRVATLMQRFRTESEKTAYAVGQEFNKVSQALSAVGVDARAVIGTISKVGLAIGGLGVGASIAELISTFSKTTEAAAGMADLSIKTGVSVEQLSRFNTVAKLSGTSIETVADMMKKLSISAVEAYSGNEKLERVWNSLGIETRELKGLAPDDLMVRFGKAIQGLDPKIVQDVVRTLGGRGGSEALVFLNELNQRLDTTASKISTEFALGAKEFEDNLVILNSRSAALANTLTSKLLPSLNALMGDMVKGGGFLSGLAPALSIDFSGNLEKQLEATKANIAHLELKRRESDDPGVWEDDIKRAQTRAKMIEDRIGFIKSIQPKETNTDANIKVEDALRQKDGASGGDNFLKGLQARIDKADQGEYAMLRLQAAQNSVLQSADPLIAKLKMMDEARMAKSYEDSLNRQITDSEFQLSLVGKTATQVEMLNIQHRNTLELQKQISEAERQKGEISVATVERMTKASEDATARQIALLESRKNAEHSWSSGATRAMQLYVESAENYSKMSEQLFTNAFNGIGNNLTQFIMTGKANFNDLANSFISDLIRMTIQAAILGPLVKMITGGMGENGIFSMLGFKDGGVFENGDKVTAFASGGVINRPTLFPMASGMGLMGEAGPEAVMPLTRDSQGRLGVKQISGSSSPGVSIVINNNSDKVEATASESTDSMGNRQIEITIANMMAKAVSSGRLDPAMRQAYNLRRSPK